MLCRFDEFLWNGTADDSVNEFEAFSWVWFETDPNITVLTMTTTLFDITTLCFASLTDGFTIVDLWSSDVDFDTEFTSHTVNDDIELKLTDTTDNGLTSFSVGMSFEGWIFFRQFLNGDIHLLQITLGLWLNGLFQDWFREFEGFKNNWFSWITKGITGRGVL